MAKKIMIVDDDPTAVHLIKSLLEGEGYEVTAAVDGLDALAKINKEKPDLIVLDIVMPEINGYDVCLFYFLFLPFNNFFMCELRFNKNYEKIPIVIVSSTEKEISDELGERVNIEYVSKDSDPKLILEKIGELLNK